MTEGNLQREQSIVATYESMAAISARMVVAARQEDWPAVVQGEDECERLIRELRAMGDLTPTDPVLRQRKMALIRTILAWDAEIRDLAQPRLAQLEQRLRGQRNSQKLANAYGSRPGA